MSDFKWSDAEKKTARRVFDAALAGELAQTLADFKAAAAAATVPDDMWAIQQRLERQRRVIEQKYDFRYSQLIFVFARLLRERRIQLAQLSGLAQDKLAEIEFIASR